MSKLVRCISDDGALMIMAADTSDIVFEAQKIHSTSKVCTAAMGRLLTAAVMMGSMFKGDTDSVTLRINGGGPCGSVIAVCDSHGHAKSYIGDAHVDLPLNKKGKLDVGGAVGTDGFLTVIKDLGMSEPYVGQVPIVSGEIAEDITAYYATSEQTPTVCALGVLVNTDLSVAYAGGFMIQLLPSAAEDTIEKVEECIKNIKSVTDMMKDGLTPEEICHKVLPVFNIEVLDTQEPVYECNCSREKVTRAILSAGKDELLDMAKDKETKVKCHFCNKEYTFTSDEIKKLAQS